MISAITTGVVLGLSAGLVPGPVLTLVITQTLKHNLREGLKIAVTPLITDLPIILLSIFVLTRLTHFNRVLGLISFAGGLYVLYLSYECFRTSPVSIEGDVSKPRSLRKGTLVNILNPQPYLFWATVGAPFILKASNDHALAPFLFVACFYTLLVGSKMSLAVVVGKSRTFLTSSGYIIIMRVLAGVLILFALFLFRDAFAFLGIYAPNP